MPTYHYVCRKCGHEFEFFQSMKDDALTVCPKERCARKPWGKGRVARQLSAGAGIIFKGSGFYITDYRSDGYKQAAKKETEGGTPKKDATTTPAAPSKSESKSGASGGSPTTSGAKSGGKD